MCQRALGSGCKLPSNAHPRGNAVSTDPAWILPLAHLDALQGSTDGSKGGGPHIPAQVDWHSARFDPVLGFKLRCSLMQPWLREGDQNDVDTCVGPTGTCVCVFLPLLPFLACTHATAAPLTLLGQQVAEGPTDALTGTSDYRPRPESAGVDGWAQVVCVDKAGNARRHPHSSQQQQQRQATQNNVHTGLSRDPGGLQQGLGTQSDLGSRCHPRHCSPQGCSCCGSELLPNKPTEMAS